MYGFYWALPITSHFLGKNSECYALEYQSTHMRSAKKSLGTILAAIVELFGWTRKVISTKGALRLCRVCTQNHSCMLEDLPETDRWINILATRFFKVVVIYIAWFGKTI